MKRLVCPKCLRHVDVHPGVTDATCTHGKPVGRFNKPVTMVPLEQLTTVDV